MTSSQSSKQDYTYQGTISSEELAERQSRVESAIKQGVEMHPDDAGDGPTRAISLDAFLPNMIEDRQTANLLSDPEASLAVGENATDQLTSGGNQKQSPRQLRTPRAAFPRRPVQQEKSHEVEVPDEPEQEQVLDTPSPPIPVPGKRYARAASKKASPPVSNSPDTESVDDSYLERPKQIPREVLIDHLLAENHRLRTIVDELAKEVGKRPSRVEPQLKSLTTDIENPESYKRLIQIVMGETKTGERLHVVVVDGKSMKASGFIAHVDEAGIFELKLRLESDLFESKKK